MSAITIFVKGWVAERADARRRPIAPAPKIRVGVGSETEREAETSDSVGGLERWIAWRQTARGSRRAACGKVMDWGSLWHISEGWFVSSIRVPSRWGKVFALLRNRSSGQML